MAKLVSRPSFGAGGHVEIEILRPGIGKLRVQAVFQRRRTRRDRDFTAWNRQNANLGRNLAPAGGSGSRIYGLEQAKCESRPYFGAGGRVGIEILRPGAGKVRI